MKNVGDSPAVRYEAPTFCLILKGLFDMDYKNTAKTWEPYNYEAAVSTDVEISLLYYIRNGEFDDFGSLEDAREAIQTVLWNDDLVTGNASGTYTMDERLAEVYLVGNGDLYEAAVKEFDGFMESMSYDAEKRDVIVRTYLLEGAIDTALKNKDVIKAFGDPR